VSLSRVLTLWRRWLLLHLPLLRTPAHRRQPRHRRRHLLGLRPPYLRNLRPRLLAKRRSVHAWRRTSRRSASRSPRTCEDGSRRTRMRLLMPSLQSAPASGGRWLIVTSGNAARKSARRPRNNKRGPSVAHSAPAFRR